MMAVEWALRTSAELIQKQRQKIQTQTLAITILETQEAHQQNQLQGSIIKERGLKIACR